MTERDFIIKVIECVEKHECLWNPLSSSYAKREQLEIAWNEIAAECEKPVSYCRDKWKNVRTGFLRSLREYPENSALGTVKTKKKPFYLHDQMQFLLPSILRNDSSTNTTHHVSHCKTETEENESTVLKTEPEDSLSSDILDYRELDNFENVQLQQEGYYTHIRTSSSNVREIEKPIIVELDDREPPSKKYRMTHNDSGESGETRQEAALMSFFKGIAPDVLSLSTRNQRFFKRKIVELVDDLHKENEMPQMLPKHITQAIYYSNAFKNGS